MLWGDRAKAKPKDLQHGVRGGREESKAKITGQRRRITANNNGKAKAAGGKAQEAEKTYKLLTYSISLLLLR
jgi:hypothetical protein